MSAGPALEGAAGFALSVPREWYELELRPHLRDASIRAVLEQQTREVPDLREHRSAIASFLRQQARRAWDAGAVYSASMVEPTEDGPVTANVTVSFVQGPLAADSADEDRLSAILDPLEEKQARSEDDTWTRVTVVDLPKVGQAARTYGVEDVELPEQAGWVRVVSMLTMVPVPGVNRVALVTCTSPVLALAEPFLDLFDAVSGSFELLDDEAAASVDEEDDGGTPD
ncbi:hypothetical protein [Kineococcus sp. NUM-3379]